MRMFYTMMDWLVDFASDVCGWLGACVGLVVGFWTGMPALWQDIAYREGIRIIPAVITAGEAFAKGERGWWGDVLYESLIDANVYTPDAYPAGWKVIE